MKNGRKDFPNKWKWWKNLPEEFMEQIEAEVMMQERIYNHIIGEDWAGCIRWTNVSTGKTHEKCYRRQGSFVNKIIALSNEDAELEVCFATPETCGGFNNNTVLFFND